MVDLIDNTSVDESRKIFVLNSQRIGFMEQIADVLRTRCLSLLSHTVCHSGVKQEPATMDSEVGAVTSLEMPSTSMNPI